MGDHLAIMKNPWMNKLISGEKTIESRISQRKIVPWNKVSRGDWIFFRLSGEHIVTHKAKVKTVISISGPLIFKYMRKHQDKIGIDEEYIKSKEKCNYLTLMFLEPVVSLGLHEFSFKKKDQRAWVTNFGGGMLL